MKQNTIDSLKGIIGTLGMSFVRDAIKDRSVLEDWITSYLNESLSKTDPIDFEVAFENNHDLSDALSQETLKQVKQFVQSSNLDIREIHNSVTYHLPSFDAKWAMSWLRKDLPEFHERILLHPQSDLFKAWLAKQIKNIGEVILNTFKNY